MDVIITSNFAEVGARFARAAAGVPVEISAGMSQAASGVRDVFMPILIAATPKRSGKLAGSTTADMTVSGSGAAIKFRQPATSDDGFLYVLAVVNGRKEIVPVKAKALMIPGIGFRMHAAAAAANPYPDRAMEEAGGAISTVIGQSGREIGMAIVRSI